MKNVVVHKGFSLIELLIAIAILAILYSVVLPSYQQFIQDGRRADVQRTLLQDVALLERQYTRQGEYPSSYSIDSTEFYSFNYSAATSTAFILEAIPLSDSSQENDQCGTLSVNYQGEKLPDQTGCWGK